MLLEKTKEIAVKLVPPGWERFPWLWYAHQEHLARVSRIGGTAAAATAGAHDTAAHKKNNPRILEYFGATTLHTDSEDTSWCSAFVNWCMFQGGVIGSRSALARSWLTWDDRVTPLSALPPIGSVVVFQRPPSKTSGHVAFVWRVEGDGSLYVLGGNQGGHAADPANHVTAAASHVSISHRKDKPLGLIWPRNWTYPNEMMAWSWISVTDAALPKDLLPAGYKR